MKNKKNEIFRLAAVLYKDGNYEVSKDNTLKKIIKAIFLENNNSSKTISEIIEEIFKIYNLNFSENEINTVIKNNPKNFQVIEVDPFKYNLTSTDFSKLKNKITEKDLVFYINEYLESIKSKNLVEDRNKLLKFLYNIFTKNLENYNFFLHLNNKNFSNLFEHNDFEEIDIDLINGFFKYESSEKDKIIFDIISLSLEYCLLSFPKELNKRQISNKTFFLDSNVIYRAIGLNGEERKNLTLQFIKRCNDYGITLKILGITENEFKSSIKYRVNKIYSVDSTNTSEKIFKKYASKDIYSYYYKWKKERAINSSREFESFIFAEYEKLKKENKISIEYNFNIDYLDNDEMLNMKNEILTFKNTSISSNGEIIAKYDTQIILSLLEIRKKYNDINKGILNINNFLISTDQQLRDWTFQKKYEQVVILLPSEWMTIMFRFLGRTGDDYKSFVSFLTLKNKTESMYSSEAIHLVLAGISQITQDINNQEYYASQIIEYDILELMENNNIREESIDKVKNYVKTDLENRLNEKIKEKKEVEENYKELENKSKILEEENRVLKEKEMKQKIKLEIEQEIKRWKKIGYYALFPLVFFILYIFAHFFWQENKYNIYVYIIKYMSSLNDFSKNFFYGVDWTITFAAPLKLVSFSYNRLFPNSEKYLHKLEKLETLVREKYNQEKK